MALNCSHRRIFPAGFRLEEKCDGEDACSSRDIIDLLPSDPFGMDIETTFTAISGWLEDLDAGGGLAGFSYLWNSALGFGYYSVPKVNVCREEKIVVNCCDNDNTNKYEIEIEERCPHEGLGFALGYLGARDLLSVGMVCKSLYSMVKSDSLLWRDVHIEQPLNERITDDVLVELASRAQGNVQCLSLVECPRITDAGIRRVLEANSRLSKLCVPGCTRLSVEGMVGMLKAFNLESGSHGIRCLRIGGLSGVTHEHFEDLKMLLGLNKPQKESDHKPHYSLRGKIYFLCDDDRAMDIELCSRCDKYRLVYDCPSAACQAKDTVKCRACAICIPRCAECGRCFSDSEYEETFCLDNICSDCGKHLSHPQISH